MLRGFWKLTWVETKVFLREPMGVFGSLGLPVILFVLLGRVFRLGDARPADFPSPPFNVPVLAVLFISLSAVISLVAIMSIYREGGILKRLRATPLSPVTILSAHVFVKLCFTVVGLLLLVLAGRQVIPGALDVNFASFGSALLLSTLSILSLGFVIAAAVPTARFAQPISAAVLYPMIAVSGLFFPVEELPTGLEMLARLLPTTHAVTLLEGIWSGAGWHLPSVVALVVIFGVLTGLASRIFRWE